MPNTKSAEKALRQNRRRRKRNMERKKRLKSAVKKYRKLLAEKKIEEARAELSRVYQVIDKMAKVRFIKKMKANRMKSRLARKVIH